MWRLLEIILFSEATNAITLALTRESYDCERKLNDLFHLQWQKNMNKYKADG
jgi:hypothetical protein